MKLLGRKLRFSDCVELRKNAEAAGRWHEKWRIQDDLQKSLEVCQCWAMWDGPHLVGVMGARPWKGVGIIWFLGTDRADKKWIGMTLACRRFKRFQHKHFEILGNFVPSFMKTRIRWLKHLGFDIQENQANVPKGYVAFWSHADYGPEDGPAAH